MAAVYGGAADDAPRRSDIPAVRGERALVRCATADRGNE